MNLTMNELVQTDDFSCANALKWIFFSIGWTFQMNEFA